MKRTSINTLKILVLIFKVYVAMITNIQSCVKTFQKLGKNVDI